MKHTQQWAMRRVLSTGQESCPVCPSSARPWMKALKWLMFLLFLCVCMCVCLSVNKLQVTIFDPGPIYPLWAAMRKGSVFPFYICVCHSSYRSTKNKHNFWHKKYKLNVTFFFFTFYDDSFFFFYDLHILFFTHWTYLLAYEPNFFLNVLNTNT